MTPRRESLFDSLSAAILDFIRGNISPHQLEMRAAALGDSIDVFLDEVLLTGARLELVFRLRLVRRGAGDGSAFLLKRVVAAGFHLDSLVPACDHRSRGRTENLVRP